MKRGYPAVAGDMPDGTAGFHEASRTGSLTDLAQQGVASEKVLEGWLWFGGLVVALLTCLVIMAYVRRRIRGDGGEAGAVFDLDELRRMRDTGELTIPEYETLRRRTIAEMGLAPARRPEEAVPSGPTGSDSETADG
jgi:hypothetical protein